MTNKKASVNQVSELVAMIARGDFDREMVQAIIDKRFEVICHQPSYADLKKAFAWVYDGYKSARFEPIDACKGMSLETREVEFELVHLNKDASTEEVLAELDHRGFRPALYEELLAFAAKYPELQKSIPIVALGSVCWDEGYLCSPCVGEVDDDRSLGMDCVNSPSSLWLPSCRFLAVRK